MSFREITSKDSLATRTGSMPRATDTYDEAAEDQGGKRVRWYARREKVVKNANIRQERNAIQVQEEGALDSY